MKIINVKDMVNEKMLKIFTKRTRSFFETVWSNVIEGEIGEHVEKSGIACLDVEEAKERIWTAYRAFNRHASENYMRCADKPLDRHKVASCYLCAVLAARPLQVDTTSTLCPDILFANEILAVTTGSSVLTGFLKGDLKEMEKDPKIDPGSLDGLKKCFEDANLFPSYVGHGDSYYLNLIRALSFLHIEENYCIPILSTLLYEWELRMVKGHEDEHKILIEYIFKNR